MRRSVVMGISRMRGLMGMIAKTKESSNNRDEGRKVMKAKGGGGDV